jgi:hypothetical protein
MTISLNSFCGPTLLACKSGDQLTVTQDAVANVNTGACVSTSSLNPCVSPSQCQDYSKSHCMANGEINLHDPTVTIVSTNLNVVVGESAANVALGEIILPTPIFPFGSIMMIVTTFGAFGAIWIYKTRRAQFSR